METNAIGVDRPPKRVLTAINEYFNDNYESQDKKPMFFEQYADKDDASES